jgi:hypothetical protein
MAIREGRWDCSSCGSTAIYGRHVDCPGCGRPRPAGVRFYLAQGEPVITDPRQLEEARAGADWICTHCEASNRALLSRCGGCGGDRDATDPVQQVREHTAGEIPRTGDAPRPVPATVSGGEDEPGDMGGSDAPPPPAGVPAPEPAAGVGESSGWVCQQCEATNPGTFVRCGECGAYRGSRNPLQKIPRTGDAPAPVPLAGGAGGADEPLPFGEDWDDEGMPLRRKVGFGVAGAIGLLVVAGLIGEVRFERTPEPVPAVVGAVAWERHVTIEQHGIVPGEGYTLPDSAIDVVRTERVTDYRQDLAGYETVTREVPRTRQVLQGYREETRTVNETEQTGTRTYTCGSRDLGNGYFEDVECTEPTYETVSRRERVSVPVYKDVIEYETVTERQPVYRQVPVVEPYYTYRAPLWTPVDTLRLSGTWLTPPAWPSVGTLPPGRREGPRWAHDRVVVRGPDGVPVTVNVHEEELPRLRPGQRVAFAPVGGRRVRDTVLPADSLPACRRWHRGRGKAPPSSLGCSPRRR